MDLPFWFIFKLSLDGKVNSRILNMVQSQKSGNNHSACKFTKRSHEFTKKTPRLKSTPRIQFKDSLLQINYFWIYSSFHPGLQPK